ncbi:MAG: hypothetical protein ACXVJ7_12915 [Acidimicrobiia bacterium]
MTRRPAEPDGPVGRPNPFRPPGRGPGGSPGLRLLHAAVIAVGATIGIVLLSRGDVVLGVLLLLFAGLRLGAVLAMRRRRRRWRAWRETRPGRPPR